MANATGAIQAAGLRQGRRKKERAGGATEADRRAYRHAFWFYLHFKEGWSIERIAGSEGAHRTTVARAVERLRAAAANLDPRP